eukprot:2936286-Pleurochrysis_carterae.AAC.1
MSIRHTSFIRASSCACQYMCAGACAHTYADIKGCSTNDYAVCGGKIGACMRPCVQSRAGAYRHSCMGRVRERRRAHARACADVRE